MSFPKWDFLEGNYVFYESICPKMYYRKSCAVSCEMYYLSDEVKQFLLLLMEKSKHYIESCFSNFVEECDHKKIALFCGNNFFPI